MKRYFMVMGGMLAVFLALFFLVEVLGVPLLVDPTPWLNQRACSSRTFSCRFPPVSSWWRTALAALFGSLPPALL
jgi:hypothetical protein